MKFNKDIAKDADKVNSQITESGTYICTITRAEDLTSKDKGTKGLGLSIKDEHGATAPYLDVYYERADGEPLVGAKTVQAILGCLKLREAVPSQIQCEKWDKATKGMQKVTVPGFPDLMGKRIGFLFQKELQTNDKTGDDVSRLNIISVFQPDTMLTVSEVLLSKTTPEILAKQQIYVANNPVKDKRKPLVRAPMPNRAAEPMFDDDSDLPF